MARLEEIIAALDGGTLSLDASLELFAEGAKLVAFCDETLNIADLRLETLFPPKDKPGSTDKPEAAPDADNPNPLT